MRAVKNLVQLFLLTYVSFFALNGWGGVFDDLTEDHEVVIHLKFSPDGKYVIPKVGNPKKFYSSGKSYICDLASGNVIDSYEGTFHFYLPNTKQIIATPCESAIGHKMYFLKDFPNNLSTDVYKDIWEDSDIDCGQDDLLTATSGFQYLIYTAARTIKFRDLTTTKVVKHLDAKYYIQSLLVSLNQKYIAICGSKTVELLDANTEKGLIKGEVSENFKQRLGFSKEGKYFVYVNDKQVEVWETETSKLVNKIPVKNPMALAVHPNQMLLAISERNDSNTIRVVNFLNSKIIHKLKHEDPISALAFSPKEEILATGSFSKGITLWDVKTGKEIRNWGI